MNPCTHFSATALVALAAVAQSNGQQTREQIARTIAPVFAAPAVDGLLIYEVLPNTQAAKAGLRIGDILTDYDGQPVTTIRELRRLFGDAISAGRNPILAVARRGNEEIEAEFDPAPMGLRMVAVRQGESRTLWRPATVYDPDPTPLQKFSQPMDRWELLIRGEDVIGWAHLFSTQQGGRCVQRIQSRITAEPLNEKRDVTASFSKDRFLRLQSLRLVRNDSTVLELYNLGDTIAGETLGIPVKEVFPRDTVSDYLAGIVAATMPQQKGACLRCSSLPANSISSAPFSDLYCMGAEKFTIAGREVVTHRYQQTVFGEPIANYWIDSRREIVQTVYSNGLRAIPSTLEEVSGAFPDAAKEFGPIEQLPDLATPATLRAN